MLLKTLKSRIKYRIKKSKDSVFVPGDFFDLSDRDQVTRVLRQLINQKLLAKIGRGLYAKMRSSSLNGKRILAKPLSDLVKEALNNKLNMKTYPSKAEQLYNMGLSTQVPTGRTIRIKARFSRKIAYEGQVIKFEHAT